MPYWGWGNDGSPIILYDNRLNDGTPVATTTASGFDVLNLLDGRAYTFWKAANTDAPCYITIDCGSAKTADCIGIIGHNFFTAGSTLTFEGSSDNFATDVTEELEGFIPQSNKAILKTFTSDSKRYWRLKISGAIAVVPYMAILMIGDMLSFPFPPDPYDMYSESLNVVAKRSKTGHLLGTIGSYIPVDLSRTFSNPLRSFISGTFKPFWDSHGSLLKPFFYADDVIAYPDVVCWASFKESAGFKMPISSGTYADNLTLDMEAIKE